MARPARLTALPVLAEPDCAAQTRHQLAGRDHAERRNRHAARPQHARGPGVTRVEQVEAAAGGVEIAGRIEPARDSLRRSAFRPTEAVRDGAEQVPEFEIGQGHGQNFGIRSGRDRHAVESSHVHNRRRREEYRSQRHSEGLPSSRVVGPVAPAEFEKRRVGEVPGFRQKASRDKLGSRDDDRRMPAVAGDMDQMIARPVVRRRGPGAYRAGTQHDRAGEPS